jgi:hemolysin activation/secretion protein
VKSKSNVAAIGTLNVIGNTSLFGLRYLVALPSEEGFSQSLSLGLDHKDFRDTVNLLGGGNTTTPIRYRPFVAAYSQTRGDKAGVTQFGATATLGVRNLFGNTETEFRNKRFDASASYLALRGDVSRLERFGNGIALFGRLDGQLASGPLVSNEQFVAGGAESVRGYRESEQAGDLGLRASAELRYALPLPAQFRESLVYGFVEDARLRVLRPLPAQQERFHVSSLGLGLKLKVAAGFRLTLDYARALRDTTYTLAGDWRTLFRLGWEL